MGERKLNIAVIDLGTNTFNLQIWEVKSGDFKVIHSEKQVVKLAQGSRNMSTIQPEPFQRALNAMSHYHRIIQRLDVQEVYAFATSGMRSASNGSEFITRIKNEMGIGIQIIDGEKEADLIFKGVRFGTPDLLKENTVIIDIGGGSTEYIVVINGEKAWSGSFKLGASRIQEMFDLEDPLSEDNHQQIENLISTELTPLIDQLKNYPIQNIVGCSGSFDTIADVLFCDQYEIDQTPNGTELPLAMYHAFASKMFELHVEDRLKMKGMIPLRADLMPISCILINELISISGANHLYLSKYALKEGAFSEMAQNLNLSN